MRRPRNACVCFVCAAAAAHAAPHAHGDPVMFYNVPGAHMRDVAEGNIRRASRAMCWMVYGQIELNILLLSLCVYLLYVFYACAVCRDLGYECVHLYCATYSFREFHFSD